MTPLSNAASGVDYSAPGGGESPGGGSRRTRGRGCSPRSVPQSRPPSSPPSRSGSPRAGAAGAGGGAGIYRHFRVRARPCRFLQPSWGRAAGAPGPRTPPQVARARHLGWKRPLSPRWAHPWSRSTRGSILRAGTDERQPMDQEW